jgi:ubiquinone/menaquinone biosynthesis C-methylase UbiE
MFHPEGPTLIELLRQALSSTEEGYDQLAPKFDLTPFRTPDALLAPMARVVGEPRSIDAALDVMCGTGAAMRVLRPLCRERVVGVDFSAGMLAEAERRLADALGDARVELVRRDVLELDYDREFDVATCVGAFGHILRRDEARLLGNIQRSLRPGGRFVFVTAETPPATSASLWIARGFNAAMRVRNALKRPPFLMYYLTMTWPHVRGQLERSGFDVEGRRGLFEKPFERAIVVVATKRGA